MANQNLQAPTLIFPTVSGLAHASGTITSATIDAVGESVSGIGRLYLEGGAGSKTISSAGGVIYVDFGATVTFANAATNLRVGIQDIGATGLEDGTFDVYADLVPGTDTIAAQGVRAIPMETGSKTISHGDLIAVTVEMTARGGVDTVSVNTGSVTSSSFGGFPYITTDTGAGPAKVATIPSFTVKFDDGTFGSLSFTSCGNRSTGLSYNSGSTPDEYALIFRLPFPTTIIGAVADITQMASTDDFELILYSDPLGTPVAQRTLTIDADLVNYPSAPWGYNLFFSSGYSISANTDYAIAIRPTTANSLLVSQINFNTGNSDLRKTTMLGTNWSRGSRTNQTGAFSSTNTVLPRIGFYLNGFDDGTGGSPSSNPPQIIGR